ncbi:MAG: sterol desaturase family protein [Deltaproteobacteria bacterium]|nr:sterol desaturase family protein [Deltaproteobacteria bacterium]
MELAVRLICFAAIFAVIAGWEFQNPRRKLASSKFWRWFSNLSIVAINTLLVRLILPIAAYDMAFIARSHHWGILNQWDLPLWVSALLSVIALDFAIYLQHVMFHAVPIFWRFHMMHHSDLDFDVTTGIRFHPIEILLSMLIKMGVVTIIGAPPIGVLLFEVLLNATSIFNHGNVALWPPLDKYLRLLVVTPEMHRVHHSVIAGETNSNFGFNFPWWDRLFATYQAQPKFGHLRMTIGLHQFRDSKKLTLPHLLALPFIGETGEYPIHREAK